MPDEPATVPQHQLREIIESFSRLTWPAGRSEAQAFATELGWQVAGDRRLGMDLATDLPVSGTRFGKVQLWQREGEAQLATITVSVSDRGDFDAAVVESAFAAVRDAVVAVCGAPAQTSAERARWDLAGGAAVAVTMLPTVILLVLSSKAVADLERAEAR